jgi:hypothetical protein
MDNEAVEIMINVTSREGFSPNTTNETTANNTIIEAMIKMPRKIKCFFPRTKSSNKDLEIACETPIEQTGVRK